MLPIVVIVLTHFIPTTTVVVVTLSIPTTTVVVVAHCIPTTTFVVVDNDLSNLSAVNRPRARNPRDTCAVNRMYYHCLCTAAIEQVLCSLRAVLTKLVTIVAESVVDFAEMVPAHDTVSDVSDIGVEFDDSIDFLDQNQTVICRLD